MRDRLIEQLEQIASKEEFIIIDNCSIVYRDAKRNNIFDHLRCNQKIAQLQKEVLEDIARFYQKVNNIISEKSAFVTKETKMEFERGINMATEKIKLLKNKNSPNKYQTQEDMMRAYKTAQADKIIDEMEKIKQKIDCKKINFKDNKVYSTLFEFFKQIRPIINHKINQTKMKYLFGDESICAAAFYFTITGEKNCPTTIVTQDHDIRKQMITAHYLFNKIDERFSAKQARNPFRLHTPIQYKPTEQPEYTLVSKMNQQGNFDTTNRSQYTPYTPEQNKKLSEIAKNTIHKINS